VFVSFLVRLVGKPGIRISYNNPTSDNRHLPLVMIIRIIQQDCATVKHNDRDESLRAEGRQKHI
jgi:hypothetical protein